MAKLKNFYKKHAPLIIGIAVYILVYFVTLLADYWMFSAEWGWLKNLPNYGENRWNNMFELQTSGHISAYFSDVLPDNSIAQIFPLSFFCYGIFEMARAMHEGVFLGFAMFTYGYLVSKAIEKRAIDSYKTISWFECVMIKYLYSNAVTALCCSIALIATKFAESEPNVIVPIVTLLIVPIIVFVFVPAVPNGLYYFIYSAVFNLVIKLINFLDESVFSNISVLLVREIIAFVVAVIIIFAFNALLMDRLLEKIQWFVSRPIVWFIRLLQKPFKKRRKKQIEKEKDLDI